MKVHHTRNSNHAITCCLLLLCLATLPGCRFLRGDAGSSSSQENTPPKPQEPSSVLQMPAPVVAEEIKGQATLPDELKLGFALDLGGRVVPGNWEVQGKVVGIDKNIIAFQTDKGESGHLVYRLPEQMQMPFKAGQPIEIKRSMRGYQVSLGYELVVTSEGRTMVGSGRLFGDKPLTASVGKDLSIQQVGVDTLPLTDDKSEKNLPVPVVVNSGNSRLSVTMGKLADVDAQDSKLAVLVTESVLVIPARGSEGVSEGQGYTLEYVVTAGGDSVPSPKP